MLLGFLLEEGGVLQGGLGVVDGTRADNDHQTVVLAGNDLGGILTGGRHDLGSLLGRRELLEHEGGSQQGVLAANAKIVRIVIHQVKGLSLWEKGVNEGVCRPGVNDASLIDARGFQYQNCLKSACPSLLPVNRRSNPEPSGPSSPSKACVRPASAWRSSRARGPSKATTPLRIS